MKWNCHVMLILIVAPACTTLGASRENFRALYSHQISGSQSTNENPLPYSIYSNASKHQGQGRYGKGYGIGMNVTNTGEAFNKTTVSDDGSTKQVLRVTVYPSDGHNLVVDYKHEIYENSELLLLFDGREILESPRSAEQQKITVQGEVKNPGPITFNSHDYASLRSVIKAAGGFTEKADKSAIQIVRIEDGQEIRAPTTNYEEIESGKQGDFALEYNDIIIVPALNMENE